MATAKVTLKLDSPSMGKAVRSFRGETLEAESGSAEVGVLCSPLRFFSRRSRITCAKQGRAAEERKRRVPLRYRMGWTRWFGKGRNPSPVRQRPEKAPSPATLSPRERAIDSILPPMFSQRFRPCSARGKRAVHSLLSRAVRQRSAARSALRGRAERNKDFSEM